LRSLIDRLSSSAQGANKADCIDSENSKAQQAGICCALLFSPDLSPTSFTPWPAWQADLACGSKARNHLLC
jgi:hypothetical protein